MAAPSKKSKTVWLRKQGPSMVLLAPFTVLFVMFTILPILAAIVLSFTYFNMVQTPTFIGLENYIRLFFDDDVFLIALKNTAIFAMITGPLSYILSFMIAWLIMRLIDLGVYIARVVAARRARRLQGGPYDGPGQGGPYQGGAGAD